MRISIGMSIKAYKHSVYSTESVAMYNVLDKMINACASRPDDSPVVRAICAHLPGRTSYTCQLVYSLHASRNV